MIDWKYAAREKLRDYEALLNAIESIPQEIEVLRLQAESIKSTDLEKDRVQGGDAGREDQLLSNIQKRGELERMLIQARARAALVVTALEALSEDDRRLLEIMYVHQERGKVTRAMLEFNLQDSRSVYKRLDKAMARFTVAYYGCTES